MFSVFINESDPEIRGTEGALIAEGVFLGAALFYIATYIGIGLVPGTPGSNRFGPKPA